jgi:DNA uptake protein ComE-like DNA-binding protein
MRAVLLVLTLALAACAAEPTETPAAPEPPDTPDSAAIETAPPGTRLNLNTATMDAFKTIPDVGDRMAHEFDEYRPYVSIQQFRREIGKYVDEAQVAAYEAYVFVPIDPNASDAPTVAQLAGVDEAEAETLVAGRPYASREAFLEALAPLVTPDELAEAEAYLTES